MEFRILGPVEVSRDGEPIPLGGGRQLAVLVALLTNADQPLSRSRLMELAWGDPPDSAEANLRTYLGRLRKALNPPVGEPRLVVDAGTVTIRVADDELDLAGFTRSQRLGDRALAAGDPAAAARHYEAAVRLWRGEPFANAIVDVPLTVLASQLRERREVVAHKRWSAALAAGETGTVIAELRAALAAEPLAEPKVELLMTGLYREGRADEALALYRDTRRRLIAELAVEPSPRLRELHHRILTGTEPASAAAPAAAPKVVPAQLPADVAGFTGRTAELDAILAEAARSPDGPLVVTALEGMAGIGKTALAVHAANRLAADYPDGQLFIDLRGFDAELPPLDPAEALDRMLRAIGVESHRIPAEVDERAALFRSTVAGRRLLLVLDNAADESQVRPLLPGGGTCLTIVTSRRSFAGLDQANSLSLDVFTPDEAVALLASVVGGERLAGAQAAAAEVVRLCGLLPLAVRVAASQLRNRPGWSLDDLRNRLASSESRLTQLDSGDSGVFAAFHLSYAELDPAARELFRRLGLHPGRDFDALGAAALIEGGDLTNVRDVLEELTDVNLLSEPGPGRFQLHDLVREFAHHTAVAEERPEAVTATVVRMLGYYHDAARLARDIMASGRLASSAPSWRGDWRLPEIGDRSAAIDWFGAEVPNVIAMADLAVHTEHNEHAWRLAGTLWTYLQYDNRYQQLLSICQAVLPCARTDSPLGHAVIANAIGIALKDLGRLSEAMDAYREAIAHSAPRRKLGGYSNLVEAQSMAGQYREALETVDAALALSEEVDSRVRFRASLLSRKARIYQVLGEYDAALAEYEVSLALHAGAGQHYDAWNCRYSIGEVYQELGETRRAMDLHRDCLAFYEKDGEREGIASSLNMLGAEYRALGDFDAALDHHQRALAIARDNGMLSVQYAAWYQSGKTRAAMGRHDRAVGAFDEAVRLAKRFGRPLDEARARYRLAESHAELADREQSRLHFDLALRLYTDINHPKADQIRHRLADGTTAA